jgi:hypothetical protein
VKKTTATLILTCSLAVGVSFAFSPKTIISDVLIEHQINTHMLQKAPKSRGNIRVISTNGVISLIGTVNSLNELNKVLTIALQNKHTKEIRNFILVKKDLKSTRQALQADYKLHPTT